MTYQCMVASESGRGTKLPKGCKRACYIIHEPTSVFLDYIDYSWVILAGSSS